MTRPAISTVAAGSAHGTRPAFLRPVWSWLSAGDLDLPDFVGIPGGVPGRDAQAALATMRAFAALVSWRSYTAAWNLLGSYDTARIRTVVGDAALGEVAAGLLLTMPSTPMICAGDELGLRGVNGDETVLVLARRAAGEPTRLPGVAASNVYVERRSSCPTGPAG